jgi:hypothetical protein
VGGPSRPEAEGRGPKVGLEDGLQHGLEGRLHDPVADRRDGQRSSLLRTGLGDPDPAPGEGAVPLAPEVLGQLVEQPVDAVPLDVGEGGPVDAGRATAGADPGPRPLQDVPAGELVMERMEPSLGVGLGRPGQRRGQPIDRLDGRGPRGPRPVGGPSHRHSPGLLLLATHGRSSGPSLAPGSCCPAGCERYYGRLRLPPGPSPVSRLFTAYGTGLSRVVTSTRASGTQGEPSPVRQGEGQGPGRRAWKRGPGGPPGVWGAERSEGGDGDWRGPPRPRYAGTCRESPVP